MSAEAGRGDALDSGMLAIGENVVAVLTFTVEGVKDGKVGIEADITARGISPAMLAQALRGVVADLEGDKCHTCGESHG